MKDVLGQAILDFHNGQVKGKLWVNNQYGPREEMLLKTYFREANAMPELEWVALQNCRGRILDIGAGAGSHALLLQKMGCDITALELSPKSAAVMQSRGVGKIINGDFFTVDIQQPVFDTLLLLMNGIGLAGTVDGLRVFFQRARTLLRPGGQLLFDSSDIAYLYKGKTRPAGRYYGQIDYQYEYNRQKSDWFNWLFIDRKTLAKVASEEGWSTEILFEDGQDQYLARCSPISRS